MTRVEILVPMPGFSILQERKITGFEINDHHGVDLPDGGLDIGTAG